MERRQETMNLRPGRGPGMRGDFAKPKNAKATLARVMRYMGEYRFKLILVAIGILISSAASIAGTYMLKPIINDHIVPWIGKGDADLTGLVGELVLLGVIYLVGMITGYLYERIMIEVSTGTLYSLRRDLFTHMQTLPLSYFDQHTHGEIMSRYTNDIDAMREMMGRSVTQFIGSAVRVTGVLIMMIVLSPLMTLAMLVMFALMIVVTRVLAKKSGFYFKLRQASLGKVNGYIEELIEGQKVVKVFCHEGAVQERFDTLNEELRENTCAANTWAMILMPIINNLSHLSYAVSAAFGGMLAVLGLIDLGSIASFLQYSRNFSMPITQLSQQLNSVMSALAGAERIFALMDESSETDGGDVGVVNATKAPDGTLEVSEGRTGTWAWKLPSEKGFELREVRGDVRFHDVTFSYDNKVDVLKNISLYAKPGQKIAFVGSTGAGKTTITNLINRFYDIEHGEITFDGIPIKRIRKADLRVSLSMVLQDTHLFTGTVRENIRYGRLDATDADVERAAKLANAHYFISHLPNGYDTILTADGANLSQGQRQLIAIARAAVADPPVLILDEATSSIDTRTEALIERGMDMLMQGRTVFVIAHRLSTVRNANAIMALEHGEIIERGDHDDLIAQRGKYYQLYMGMFELS